MNTFITLDTLGIHTPCVVPSVLLYQWCKLWYTGHVISLFWLQIGWPWVSHIIFLSAFFPVETCVCASSLPLFLMCEVKQFSGQRRLLTIYIFTEKLAEKWLRNGIKHLGIKAEHITMQVCRNVFFLPVGGNSEHVPPSISSLWLYSEISNTLKNVGRWGTRPEIIMVLYTSLPQTLTKENSFMSCVNLVIYCRFRSRRSILLCVQTRQHGRGNGPLL